MSDKDEAAFPIPRDFYMGGMTLRDWFAGQAVMGLIACPDTTGKTMAGFATDAYQMADAMLAARGEP